MVTKKSSKILLIDIPVYRRELPLPYRKLLTLSLKAEKLIRDKLIEGLTREHNMYSRGLLSIASYLEKQGITVKYVSYEQDIGDPEVIKELENVKVVGITCVTPSVCLALHLCQIIKAFDKHIVCILGGPHVSYIDEHTLVNHPEVDIIVRGEGEITLLDILYHLDRLDKVDGITYRGRRKIIRNKDRREGVSRLPIINYAFLPKPLRSYAHNVMVTRGCPYNCEFCVAGRLQEVKGYSIGEIVDELRFLDNNLKEGSIVHFCDSNLPINKARCYKLLDAIKREKFHIFFSCDMRTDLVTRELIQKLEAARFVQVNLGFEDLNNEVLGCMAKGLDFEFNVQACKTIRKNSKLMIKAYLIAGLPNSSYETIHDNIMKLEQLFDLNLVDLVSVKVLVPYPGTSIFHEPESFGVTILTKNWQLYDRFSPPVYRLNALNEYEVYSYFQLMEAQVLRGYCQKLG
jgi:anaerobic magnesium-protoporphyrin IX monomethyl ester cyclase